MLNPFNESVFAAAIHFGLGIHEPSWTILCCTCNVKLSQADFQFSRHMLKGVNDEHPTFLLPLTKRLHIRRRAVAQPAVQLGLVFELLAAQTGNDDEARIDLGKRGHVAPEFLELRHWKNILLAVPQRFFTSLSVM